MSLFGCIPNFSCNATVATSVWPSRLCHICQRLEKEAKKGPGISLIDDKYRRLTIRTTNDIRKRSAVHFMKLIIDDMVCTKGQEVLKLVMSGSGALTTSQAETRRGERRADWAQPSTSVKYFTQRTPPANRPNARLLQRGNLY